jgi:hypothetical protein
LQSSKDQYQLNRADLLIDVLLRHSGDIGEEIAQSGMEADTLKEKNHVARAIINAAYKHMSTKDFLMFASNILTRMIMVEEAFDITIKPDATKADLHKALLTMAAPANGSTIARAAGKAPARARKKSAEINKHVDSLINKFKRMISKTVSESQLRREARKLALEYVQLKTQPVDDPNAIAGGIFYYVTRSRAGKVTHGIISQEDIARATKFTSVTIRKVIKVLEQKHGKNDPSLIT